MQKVRKITTTLSALILALSILTAFPAAAAITDEPAAEEEIATEAAPEPGEASPAIEDDADGGLAASAATNAPAITSFQNEATGAKFTWNGTAGKQYRLFYKDTAADAWHAWKTVTGTSYTDTALADAQERWYTVSAAETPALYNNTGWHNVYYAAPELGTLKNADNGVLLEWNVSWKKRPAWNGEHYIVYRKTAKTSWARIKEGLTEGSYTDTTAVNGTTYYYTVRMSDQTGKKFLSSFVSSPAFTCQTGYPTITKIENLANGARLTWNKYNGAAGYRVYYKNGDSWTRLIQTNSLTCTDTSVQNGGRRVYTVRAVNKSGAFVSNFKSAGWSNTYFAPPVIDSLTVGDGGITLRWTRTANAPAYRIYRKSGSSSWARIAQTGEASYTDRTVQSGASYTYTLRVVDANDRLISDFNSGKTISYTVPPAITAFENLANGAKVTWNGMAGAYAYRLYRKSGENWIKLTETRSLSYTDTDAPNAVIRVYTVRAVNNKGKFVSDFNHDGWGNVFFEPPVIKSLTPTNTGVTIAWERARGAQDYCVYRKTASTSWQRIAKTAATSYTDETAQTGVEYTYTLRMITTDDERFMSYFNSGKSITRFETPEITSIENTADGALIRWNAVNGADSFRVYYQTANGWTRLDTCFGTAYTDDSVADGETRVYTIRGMNASGNFATDFNAEGWSNTFYAAPALSAVTCNGAGHYTLSWQPRENVASYRLYRREFGGELQELATVTGSSYRDNTTVLNGIYTYTLRYDDSRGKPLSGYRTRTPYYRSGALMNGTVTIGDVEYSFDNGVLQVGLVVKDGNTYYYGEDGRLLVSQIVGSASTGWYYADENGICYTSEDMRRAAEFMMTVCRGTTLQERMKYGYLYIAKNYPYERRYNAPKDEKTMPSIAIDMFTNHAGNCYCYATCFAYMAKISGYRVRIAIGETGGGTPHGWAEVYVDGKWLYCDPESELPRFNKPDYISYMKEKHYWSVKKSWSTELTVENGKVTWQKPI